MNYFILHLSLIILTTSMIEATIHTDEQKITIESDEHDRTTIIAELTVADDEQSHFHTRVNGFKYHPTLLVECINIQHALYSSGPVIITKAIDERALGVTGQSFFNGDVIISGSIIPAGTMTPDIVNNNVIVTGNVTVTGTINGNVIGTVTNAENFTGQLLGDVIGGQNNTQIILVGGQTAAAVANAAIVVASATDANVPNTLVLRDGSGAFSGTLLGNATGFSGMLAGDVSGPQSNTQVDFVGGQPAAAVANIVTIYGDATSANVPNTLVLRDGSGGFASGSHVISNTMGDSLTVSKNINLLNSDFTDPENGVIEINGTPFISTFSDDTSTFVGYDSGSFFEAILGSTFNTGIGYRTTRSLPAAGLTSIITYIGAQAGENATTQTSIGIGFQALQSATNGNNGVGYTVMKNITTGERNTCMGSQAGLSLINGNFNTCIGADSGASLSSGSNNTLIGRQTGLSISTGSGNTCIGVQSGSSLTTGNDNIDIGNIGVAGESNTVRIGNNSHQSFYFNANPNGLSGPGITPAPGGTQTLSIGIVGGGVPGQVYRTVSSARYKENINPLPATIVDDLLALEPVSFTIKGHDSINYGLIAEDVDVINKDLVIYNEQGQPESLNQGYLIPMLIAACQEQQKLLDAQSAAIAFLKEKMKRIQSKEYL